MVCEWCVYRCSMFRVHIDMHSQIYRTQIDLCTHTQMWILLGSVREEPTKDSAGADSAAPSIADTAVAQNTTMRSTAAKHNRELMDPTKLREKAGRQDLIVTAVVP